MGTLIIVWNDDSCETFNCSREELEGVARYWIRRRYEKMGAFPKRAFFVENEIDVKKIISGILADESRFISGILADESRYAKELQEQRDKQEYERLRIKFGDGDEESHEQRD